VGEKIAEEGGIKVLPLVIGRRRLTGTHKKLIAPALFLFSFAVISEFFFEKARDNLKNFILAPSKSLKQIHALGAREISRAHCPSASRKLIIKLP
jgi:hypothetical protein